MKERAKEWVIKYSETLTTIQVLYHEPTGILVQPTRYTVSDFTCQKEKNKLQREKQVADFIIKTGRICEKMRTD